MYLQGHGIATYVCIHMSVCLANSIVLYSCGAKLPFSLCTWVTWLCR